MIYSVIETLNDFGLDAEEVTTERGIELQLSHHLFCNPLVDIEIDGIEAGIEALIYDLQEELDLDFDYRVECGAVYLIPLI